MEAPSMVLKRCAAEKTKEVDSSKLVEDAADAMEASSSVVIDSSLLTKRKAEFEPEEEEESDEEAKIDEPEPEPERDDMLDAPEWDVDSFDGLKYYSSPDFELSSSLPDEDVALENYRIDKRQIIESKGFYADPELRRFYGYKGIQPMSLDRIALRGRTFREYWEEMVHVCLQKHNQDKDPKVEFVEVVRGNYRGGPRSKSYITFMAREKPDGPLVEYQAKAMATLDGKRHPILCRPAPIPKP